MANKRSISDEWKSWVARGGSAQNVSLSGLTSSNGAGGSGGSGSKGGGGQSPLSWLLDIVSRPRYAVTGAISRGVSAAKKGSNAADAIGMVLSGARDGFFSTNPKDHVQGIKLIDQIGKAVDKNYTPRTLGSKPNMDDPWKDIAAVGRGLGGFGVDVAADPLTYGTLGAGTAIKFGLKGAAKALGSGTKAAKAAEEAAPAIRATEKASEATPVARAAEEATPRAESAAPILQPARATGAANVAGASKALSRGAGVGPLARPAAAAQGFKIGDTLAAGMGRSLPKVSETITTHNGGAVEALLNAQRRIAQAGDEIVDTAAAATRATPAQAAPASDLKDFATSFFAGADDTASLGRLSSRGVQSEVFPRNIINQLGKGTRQAQLGYLNRLVGAAKNPATGTPELRRFLTEAQQFLKTQRGAGAAKAPKAAPAAAAAPRVAELLERALRQGRGLTPEGQALKENVGNELFSRLLNKRSKPETREKVFNDISRILTKSDEVTPAELSAMDDTVQSFVRDRLQLRPEDFDMAARQKFMDYDIIRSEPRATNPKTAAGVPQEELTEIGKFAGISPKLLAQHVYEVASKIARRTITGRDGEWRNGRFFFKTDEGLQYSLKHGRLDQYALVDWANHARAKIDATVPLISSGKRAGKPSFQAITAARREQLPKMVRAIEDKFESMGVPLGVYADDTFISLRQTDIYDSIRALADAPPPGMSRADVERIGDTLFFNAGTAAPESLMAEAYGAAIKGADDKLLHAILGQNKSKYNGVSIKRQPLGEGRNATLYSGSQRFQGYKDASGNMVTSSDQLRQMAVSYIRHSLPYVEEKAATVAGRYVEKSVTDASAMTSRAMIEANEAMARGEGPGMAYMADLEKRVTELVQEYGASGHAAGLTSEELAKQLPPFIVQRSKSVRSTGRAFTQAARAGKSASDIRRAGQASEFKHSPVDDAAAVDLNELDDLARGLDESSDLYGLGTGVNSVRDAEVAARGLWQRFVHPFQKGFNQHYGTTIEGVDLTTAPRYAVGSPAKDIFYMNHHIDTWGKKYNTIRLGDTQETIGSAAFKMLQRGVDEVPAELLQLPGGNAVAQALEELRPVASRFFDIDGTGFMGDLYWRTGSKSIGFLERGMKTSGLERKYGDLFSERLQQGEEAITGWWRDIDIENPVEFLKQYNNAVHNALGDRVAMHSLVKQLRSAGLVSDTAKAGFAKPALEGKSFFFAGLEDSGLFIDKRVLDSMSEVDKMVHAARGFGENSLITTAIDPALGAWKQGMTIFRVGHHVRNAVSNAGLAFVDQGVRNLAKSGVVAAKILARREGGRALEGIGEVERLLLNQSSGLGKKGSEIVQTTKLPNGKKLEFTYDDLHDAASARANFRTYRQSEDIIEGQGLIQRGADLATGRTGPLAPVGRAAGAVSEGVDHHGLLQHFIQITLNNAKQVGGKFKSVDDLYDYAMKRAYRFHPDSNVLTPFEAKYMRRVIPFYTWFKGTLPAVLESSLMHPGRVLIAPKASFNIAQTYGIDGESISNPWPEDADIPEYMKEMAFGANALFGDQMFAMNPGLAHQDLASDFLGRGPMEGQGVAGNLGSNAMSALWDMVTPFVKMPVELMAGEKLSSQNEKGEHTKIRQAGDYVDDSIPFLNYLSKNTGISFGSTIAHPIEAMQQGRPIERSDVQMGYTPSIFDEGVGEKQKVSLINWLFGQNAQRVDTKEQNAARQDEAKQRRADREERGLYVAPKAQMGSSSGGSSGGGSSSGPMPEFNLPSGASNVPEPESLSSSEAAKMVEELLGSNTSAYTKSYMMKALQQERDRQNSSRYRTEYYLQNLQQLQAANPELSLSELMKIMDKAYTDYQ